MKLVFSPAELLMNRLNYPSKFALIGLLVFLAFASLMWTIASQLNRTIERAENELVASALARPLSKLVELTQQHRGVSAMLLGGNLGMADRRSALQANVDGATAELNRVLADDKRSMREWQDIGRGWDEIKRDVQGWSQAQSYQAHTALIGQLLNFQTLLSDAYGLTFDPEPQTYYLMTTAVSRLPFLIERLGRLRGSASAMLAKGAISDEQRTALIVITEEIRSATVEMERSMDKVIAQRPELQVQLQRAMATLRERGEAVDRVVQGMVLRGDFTSTSSAQFFDMTTEAIGIAYTQMYDVLLPNLDQLLQQRIDDARQMLHGNLAVLLVVLAVIGYLSVGAYLSVMTSIRSLREGSERLAAGDLTATIELAARDELRYVAGSFNDMAGAMRALIGSIKSNSDHVADSARSLATASGQIHVASQCQSDAASSMAAAVEQMTVGIESIARNAGEADALAHRSGELSRQGGEIVAAVVEEISQIAQLGQPRGRLRVGAVSTADGFEDPRSAAELMSTDAEALGRFWADPYGFTPPGGEPLLRFEARVLAAIERVRLHFAGRRVLVIGHAGVMRLLLAQGRGLPRERLLEVNVAHGELLPLSPCPAGEPAALDE